MAEAKSRQIIVAGAGIAGLTAALAFAGKGFSVRLYERSPKFEDVGAGIQLSPNATRLLGRLGVLDALLPATVKPTAINLIDGRTLKKITQVPLGEAAEKRWGAPYLVVHRADLQSVLATRVQREPDILLTLGAAVRDFAIHPHGVTASVDVDGRIVEAGALLLVGADGVWSGLRRLAGSEAQSQPSGHIAWRSTVRADGPAATVLASITDLACVTAFMHPAAHLIAYPLRGGTAINLVAITPGELRAENWAARGDQTPLLQAARRMAPDLAKLVGEAGPWTAWPIHTVPASARWIAPGGVALIGDAAHAMTPFAAQGAAMGIEDAVTLADRVSAQPGDIPTTLATWEAERRPRIERVIKRGAFNRFAWHASGPVAFARNFFLRHRDPQKLAADLDWLYGWKP